jgi:hypothetical protein
MGMETQTPPPENDGLRKEVQLTLFGEEALQNMKQLPRRDSNVRRERFVREYVLCGRNATEAAFRAGYGGGDRRACTVYGSELLTFPDVQQALQNFEGEIKARDLVRADEIVEAAWKTYDEIEAAGRAHLGKREPVLTLLARLGCHFQNDKVEVNNLISVKDLVAADGGGANA